MMLIMKTLVMAVISYSLRFTLLLALSLPLLVFAQEAEVKAEVAVSIQQVQEIWAGQQVTFNLDLKTTGFSFSDTHFNLPEVNGAFLMQTDSTTIKLSEKADGLDWQILRYPLALFPQKSGQLEIPAIDVRFSSAAGFGSEEKHFEFKTEPLEVSIALPPGVKRGDIVVTTRSFQLEHDWQPASDIAKTGDAFTLTVRRSADDISSMLLPPLPVYQTEGLAVYPQSPEIEDKTNRGDLVGERTDTIIWLVEEAGSYAIPGIRFQWWDPRSQELKQQLVPGIQFEVPTPSSNNTGREPGAPVRSTSRNVLTWLVFLLAGLVTATLWFWSRKKTDGKNPINEKSTFARLQESCKSNQATETYSAIYAWLACCPSLPGPVSKPMTLDSLARSMNDEQLAGELRALQFAMTSSNADWRGETLLTSLKRIRHRMNSQKIVQSTSDLAHLNP